MSGLLPATARDAESDFRYSLDDMAQNADVEARDSEEAAEAPAPITSRFLFVDVAAQRAKQLRRGALVRLDRHAGSHLPHKLERVAMEEVRCGLIEYTLPTKPEKP
jgi:DNA-directed RNA polymerase subunit K/omega